MYIVILLRVWSSMWNVCVRLYACVHEFVYTIYSSVGVGMVEAKVCAYLYSISHDSAYLSRQEVVVIINGSVNLFAAVPVQFDPQNYTVTEGGVVGITLVTNTSDYMFNFTVTLQYMNGSATGESSNAHSHKHLRSF